MRGERCTGRKTNGDPCRGWRVDGSDKCNRHLFNPDARAKAAVRAEVLAWGLGSADIDPGETLLKLVSQSAARAEHYAQLLQDAYDAADRLKRAHEARELVDAPPERDYDDEGKPLPLDGAVQTAMADLERIFGLGGVAALIGNTYGATNTGSVYATGEAIRGLAKLESEERDRCAGFAAKAIAAGLAERQVRLAEKQGALIADVLRAVLNDPELGLSAEQRGAVPGVTRRHLALVS